MSSEISDFIHFLKTGNESAREAASEQLLLLGEDAKPAAIQLALSTADANEIVSENAVATLEELGKPETSDLNALTQLIQSNKAPTAYWAVTLIGRLGSDASSALTDLLAGLTDSTPLEVQQRIVWAIGKFGPSAATAKPQLQKLTNHDDPRLARLAQQALDSMQ